MVHHHKSYLHLVQVLCFIVTWKRSGGSYDTLGREFVFAFPKNSDGNGTILYVNIANPNDEAAKITIESSFLTSIQNYTTVPAHSINKVFFPSTMQTLYSEENNIYGDLERKGISITSDRPVSVVAVNGPLVENKADNQTSIARMYSFLVIPKDALDTRYIAVTTEPHKGSDCHIATVATVNDTTIKLTLTDGYTYQRRLNRLQTFTYYATADLSGTAVEASAPVAVISGCALSHLAGRDTIAEMMIPTSRWGSEIPFVTFADISNDDFIKVVVDPQTEVTVNRRKKYTIDRGQSELIPAMPGSFSSIEASNPVSVSHIGQQAWRQLEPRSMPHSSPTWTGIGDGFLVNVLARKHFISGKCLFSTLLPEKFYIHKTYHYINIVTIYDLKSSMRLNNRTIDKNWTRIGTTDFYFVRVPISVGDHTMECVDPKGFFAVTIYGYGWEIGYGYVCGMNLPKTPIAALHKISVRVTASIVASTAVAVIVVAAAISYCVHRKSSTIEKSTHYEVIPDLKLKSDRKRTWKRWHLIASNGAYGSSVLAAAPFVPLILPPCPTVPVPEVPSAGWHLMPAYADIQLNEENQDAQSQE